VSDGYGEWTEAPATAHGSAPCSDLAGQAFTVFDGHEFRACRAAAAIATVVKAKQPCKADGLSAIRTAPAE
jgi:hypothetical protein